MYIGYWRYCDVLLPSGKHLSIERTQYFVFKYCSKSFMPSTYRPNDNDEERERCNWWLSDHAKLIQLNFFRAGFPVIIKTFIKIKFHEFILILSRYEYNSVCEISGYYPLARRHLFRCLRDRKDNIVLKL